MDNTTQVSGYELKFRDSNGQLCVLQITYSNNAESILRGLVHSGIDVNISEATWQREMFPDEIERREAYQQSISKGDCCPGSVYSSTPPGKGCR